MDPSTVASSVAAGFADISDQISAMIDSLVAAGGDTGKLKPATKEVFRALTETNKRAVIEAASIERQAIKSGVDAEKVRATRQTQAEKIAADLQSSKDVAEIKYLTAIDANQAKIRTAEINAETQQTREQLKATAGDREYDLERRRSRDIEAQKIRMIRGIESQIGGKGVLESLSNKSLEQFQTEIKAVGATEVPSIAARRTNLLMRMENELMGRTDRTRGDLAAIAGEVDIKEIDPKGQINPTIVKLHSEIDSGKLRYGPIGGPEERAAQEAIKRDLNAAKLAGETAIAEADAAAVKAARSGKMKWGAGIGAAMLVGLPMLINQFSKKEEKVDPQMIQMLMQMQAQKAQGAGGGAGGGADLMQLNRLLSAVQKIQQLQGMGNAGGSPMSLV